MKYLNNVNKNTDIIFYSWFNFSMECNISTTRISLIKKQPVLLRALSLD